MAHSILYIQLMNSKEWRVVRNTKLFEQPYCEECLRHGISRQAEVVHHIREVESGRSDAECRTLAFATSNLQSLCRNCHKKIHIGSHSKQAHKQRASDRLEQFKSGVVGKVVQQDLFSQDKAKPAGD